MNLRNDGLGRFLVGAALLAVFLPLTWTARQIHVARVEAQSGERQRAVVDEALDQIEAHFSAMQAELIDRAERVAEAPVVIDGLRTRQRRGLTIGPESVVSHFSELDVPYGASVELYDPNFQLVAWKGFSMSIEPATGSPPVVHALRTAISVDDLRQALVVWVPVRSGPRVLGVVRAMRLVRYDAPVRNEYIRDVSLVQQWNRLTNLPASLTLDPVEAPAGSSRILEGVDGSVLGRISVVTPAAEQLVEEAAARFNDILVFWTVLLIFWVMGGAWSVYRHFLKGLPPGARSMWRAVGWFAAVATLWWLVRFALLEMNVPGRWQQGREPLAPLFDPIHFASGLGGGLLRSTGDFLITSIFFLVFAVAFAEVAQRFGRRAVEHYRHGEWIRRAASSPGRAMIFIVGGVAAGTIVVEALTLVIALTARHVVLDSTFDFLARRGLVPETLLLLVYGTLILAAIGVLLLSVGVVWITASAVVRRSVPGAAAWTFWSSVGLSAAIPLLLLYSLTTIGNYVSWPVSLSMLAVPYALAVFVMHRESSRNDLFVLRSILPAIFLVTVLLYPMLYSGVDARRRIQMVDAAETFAEGRDPRVLFAIEQLLRGARTNERVQALLANRETSGLDTVAASSFHGSLLLSLPAYDVSVTFFDEAGRALGRYFDTGQMLDAAALAQIQPLQDHILRQMYEEAGDQAVVVAPITGVREPDRFQFEGIAPVVDAEEADTLGWVTARAEPQTILRNGGTPFPRVLLPSGSYDDLFANLSIAHFRDGLLVRSMGRDFGRYRLSDEIVQALATESTVWRAEVVEARAYQTFYLRHVAERGDPTLRLLPVAASSVVAVRVPSITTFDHLYYLLRLTVAGFFIGLPLYLFGLYVRRREGLLPAPRVRFRDKVLNAFLGVGIISVAAVGFVGLQVVTTENERAVQSWLRQHLERVEETLALDARGEEMPYSVLEHTRIDSLAARVGLDLNVYSEHSLVDLSRPQLAAERLIDVRLPIEAYQALYFEGYRFIDTYERVGSFRYRTGFRALPDEQGRPRYVISVPTLPEQERIEEERARTVAYLFGSLLLLVLVVMLTASLLANAISRPIARLRSGLKAVAAGRFERMLPVDSRDEIGELVETFNEMQQQLAESRRKLAQQERQLAWREMARQVAHEIKNPLTPMKLSVQHLRRAYEHREEDAESGRPFPSLFERITSTLIEQIDALARIANEFHSFARMPSRIMEHLDVNAVVDEAAFLMQEEREVDIHLNLSEQPLVVEADREELRRIYINLIKNAMQAIPEDAEGHVEIRTERRVDGEGEWAFSYVRDTGEGIEAEARDRIFEPNFSTKTSGTGLGLAIVRKSVEELQGDIGFETEDGIGTTFWVRLPLAEEERPA